MYLFAGIPNPVTDPFDFIKYIGRFSLILLEFKYEIIQNQKPWLDILPTINRPIMTKWISASTLIQVGGIIY
jgi:hypothetical protein